MGCQAEQNYILASAMPVNLGTSLWAMRWSAMRVVIARAQFAAGPASRFLALQPIPFSDLASTDRTIFILESARSELALETLRFSAIRLRAYPVQFLRFIRANIHLWIIVKAVEAMERKPKGMGT